MTTLPGYGYIDQDVKDSTTAFILTKTECYRTTNLDGVTTWTLILINTAWSSLTDVVFSRLRCSKVAGQDFVYIIGAANGSTSDNKADAVCFYSSTNGNVWNYKVIEENVVDYNEIPITLSTGDAFTASQSQYTINGSLTGEYSGHLDLSGTRASILWQSPSVRTGHFNVAGGTDTIQAKIQVIPNPKNGKYDEWRPAIRWPGYEQYTLGTEIEEGIYEYTLATEDVDAIMFYRGNGDLVGVGESFDWGYEWEILEWNNLVNGADVPIGFDIGRHTPATLYVGTEDKIYKSTDNGVNWTVLDDTVGAYDIECHYAQDPIDAEITFWGSDGSLYRTSGGVVSGVFGGVADVEPKKVPFRVASDPVNGFPIFVLEYQGSNSYKLKRSVDGVVWTDEETGLADARSLKSYAIAPSNVRRWIYTASTGIFLSVDDGATFVDKKGDYPYISPGLVNLY